MPQDYPAPDESPGGNLARVATAIDDTIDALLESAARLHFAAGGGSAAFVARVHAAVDRVEG